MEKASGTKHEFHNGEIFALAGGSVNYGLLCGNTYSAVRDQLKKSGSNCKPLNSEIRLYIEKQNRFVYPDVMVICGDLEISKQEKNSVINPVLIVEVLSDSTAAYDRGDKFFAYRQIPTFREYVLIEQHRK